MIEPQDLDHFYATLFRDIEQRYGPLDPETIAAIIGFDVGGPLAFNSKRNAIAGNDLYVTCELAIRDDQISSRDGRFELMAIGPDLFDWCRHYLSAVGAMSLREELGSGHTVDVSTLLRGDENLSGLVIETFSRAIWQGTNYAVLLVVGVTTAEMLFAQRRSVAALKKHLVAAGVWPLTTQGRVSCV